MQEKKRGKDFDRMVVEAVQGGFSFFAWQSVDGVVEKCELRIKSYKKERNEIEFEAAEQDKTTLIRILPGNRIVNIYVPELSIAFNSEIKSITEAGAVKMGIPGEYSFYERRKHKRLSPLKTCYLTIELNKVQVKKSIFDISIGGLAVILPKSEKVLVQKGKTFSFALLEIAGRKIKCQVECVNAVLIDRFKLDTLPYGGYKIAFRFIGMSKEDHEYLSEFVTHQMIMLDQVKKAN